MENNPFESKRESISARTVINAPSDYVSVFHETKEKYLPSIDQHGLKAGAGVKNVGEHETMQSRNTMIDALRPAGIQGKGISRNNIYAYPFLAEGNGLLGADERFTKRRHDPQILRDRFSDLEDSEYIAKLGVKTAEEYIGKVTDPEYLKKVYPGEVIEMKVDPEKVYVGDLNFITQIQEGLRWYTEQESVEANGKDYWASIVSLKDFFRWYRYPEYAENGNDVKTSEEYKDGKDVNTMAYCLLKGAPDYLPSEIKLPEILIPQDIPQEHIKLVR
jgi:hypothetical protein